MRKYEKRHISPVPIAPEHSLSRFLFLHTFTWFFFLFLILFFFHLSQHSFSHVRCIRCLFAYFALRQVRWNGNFAAICFGNLLTNPELKTRVCDPNCSSSKSWTYDKFNKKTFRQRNCGMFFSFSIHALFSSFILKWKKRSLLYSKKAKIERLCD